jgi:cyclopropane fatty-acyl-phospholipid synthase-like methyltransferase
MTEINYEVWKTKDLAKKYLNGIRGAFPLEREQFEVFKRLIISNDKPVKTFLDIGSGDGILSSYVLSCYPDAKGTLLDLSEHMIKQPKKNLMNSKIILIF